MEVVFPYNLAQAGAEAVFVVEVANATADDANAGEPDGRAVLIRALPMPAKVIIGAGPGQRPGSGERTSDTSLQFRFEFWNAPIVQDVLQAGQFTVDAIAEIAMNGDNRGGDFEQFFFRWANRTDRIGQARVGGFDSGALSHAAACQNCKAGQTARLVMRNNANIVSVQIGGVVAGKGESDFEFTRQIGRSVERFGLLFFRCGGVFAIHPNVVVSGSFRLQAAGQKIHVLLNVLTVFALEGSGAGDRVSNHVSAGGQSRKIAVVQAANQFAQTRFRDVMVLNVLAGGDAQRAVAEVGQAVER